MRVLPVLLIVLGVFGLFEPQYFIAEDKLTGFMNGRWVFIVIMALGVLSLWRTIQRMKNRSQHHGQDHD